MDFWQGYNQLSDANREVLISPVLNKIRQLLLRKELRAMLASTSKKFNLMELFTSKKVVLVNLNRGQIGVTNAKFIGSLITNYIYQLTLYQARLAPENRPFLPIYIDELGQFLKLPVDLEDALAVSRSMKVGYILASQHLTQLPSTLRTSVLSNCRSKSQGTRQPSSRTHFRRFYDPCTFSLLCPNADFLQSLQVGLRAKSASFEKYSAN